MFKKIEHIGIAVKDLDQAQQRFNTLYDKSSYKTEEVAGEKVKTVFFQMGETKIELLEALEQDSPIARFVEKRGEGVHHIAYEVEDIKKEIARLQQEGFEVINETPKPGADNKWVAFLHPKSTHGVLTELCQDKST
jgi:methylmalonyl-CoA/ethylmalonyl-CoA epimerase